MTMQQLWIKIKDILVRFWEFVIKNNPFIRQRFKTIAGYVRRSWKSIAVVLPVFLMLYYGIGGYVTNNISKETTVEFNDEKSNFSFINAGAYLIKQEVDDNMWTSNLPFIFPGVVLDNMPSYQKGIMQAVKVWVKNTNNYMQSEELKSAYKLLKYPPNIWILSKGENLALAPSSGAQYRKARKELLKFNTQAEYGKPDTDFAYNQLNMVEKNLNKVSADLEKQVLEFSSDWVDFKADEVFYLNQGKIYAHYIMLKAFSQDIMPLVTKAKQYENLTSMFKALEDALKFEPSVVRNGEIDNLTSANHLMSLNYYIVKATYYLSLVKNGLIREN